MRILFLLILSSSLWAEMTVQDITYMTEHYPPNNFVDEYGTLQGYSVEVLKEMWKKMGCTEQKIAVLPWARGYMKLKSYKGQMLFTMVRTSSRDSLFKWVGPLSSSSVILVGKKNKKGRIYLNNLSELKKYRVGVIRSDAGEQMLLSKNIPSFALHQSLNLTKMIQLLNSNRVDLICLGEQSYRNLRKNAKSDDYYHVYTVETIKDYFAFSRDVPDSLIAEFQAALDSIRDTQKVLLEKWHMNLNSE